MAYDYVEENLNKVGPAALPGALQAPANEAVVARDRPHLPAELEPSPPVVSIVVLAGRATRMP